MLASDKNKKKEDEALNLSIPSDFLPYKSLSGEYQQEEWGDMGSPIPFRSPAYNSLPEEFRFKEEMISFDPAGIGFGVENPLSHFGGYDS